MDYFIPDSEIGKVLLVYFTVVLFVGIRAYLEHKDAEKEKAQSSDEKSA